jgi:hypothetical protein
MIQYQRRPKSKQIHPSADTKKSSTQEKQMIFLNEVTLLTVGGISLHANASLAIFDGE